MILHAETRTITADVNGDNMYDAIKITDNAVYVVDKMLCCTKKRFPIISSCDSMYDVLVNDFAPSFRSDEVAIVFGKETATSTIVYAFNNGAFVKISDNLPGMITRRYSCNTARNVYADRDMETGFQCISIFA
jgi:uncharacterized protein YtpQ (UPF0354 family)